MQLTTHRTPAPVRVPAMSEYIGRLQAEIARRQSYFDRLAGSPWDLLLVDADAALKRACQRLEVAASVPG
jgi:hypothetical protein